MNDSNQSKVEELLALNRSQAESIAQLQETVEQLNDTVATSSARMRSILANLPLSLVIINNQGLIEAVNNKTLETFRYTKEELIDQPMTILFSDPSVLRIDENAIETSAIRKGGELFPCEARVTEVEMGSTVKLFIHVQDVSEKHKLEQLRKDFLLMVSHDLRNPLIAIIGFFELLHEGSYGEISSKMKPAATRAQSTAEYLNSLVDDLLDAERLEQGDIELDIKPVSLVDLVQKAVATQRDQAGGIELVTDVDDITVSVDEDRMLQVLINLISNALKFSPPGSRVRIMGKRGDDNRVIITVSDTGPGIPEHQLESIFERYVQVGLEKKTKRRGFGLGLSIVKRLVEKHGGTIRATSKEGEGSQFIIELRG